ncbi:MAG: thiamine phosphate synthase [Candidatus Methanoplasma sp.]|jgi:thiamine-phosphate pyrophosphorylase|nr:thiamine phosphate synthase [Candidatus Methanoplasma sp.]
MIAAITDSRLCGGRFAEQMGRIARARPDLIILREKWLSPEEYRALASEALETCRAAGAELCANSFSDVAAGLGIRRIQLSVGDLRRLGRGGFDQVIASVHSAGEAREAEDLGADALVFGNVFETACKPGAPARGLAALGEVCGAAGAPVLAVGGIDEGNMRLAMAAGAAGVCMRGRFMEAEDPAGIVRAYREMRASL